MLKLLHLETRLVVCEHKEYVETEICMLTSGANLIPLSYTVSTCGTYMSLIKWIATYFS